MSGDRVVARAVDSAFRCDVCGERCTSKRALDEHATAHPVTADVQRELVEVIDRHAARGTTVPDLAAALLPTVQRIAYLRAAEEVRTVRQWLLETGRADADTLRQLRDRVDQIAAEVTVTADRAAALDPSGAAEGAGR